MKLDLGLVAFGLIVEENVECWSIYFELVGILQHNMLLDEKFYIFIMQPMF